MNFFDLNLDGNVSIPEAMFGLGSLAENYRAIYEDEARREAEKVRERSIHDEYYDFASHGKESYSFDSDDDIVDDLWFEDDDEDETEERDRWIDYNDDNDDDDFCESLESDIEERLRQIGTWRRNINVVGIPYEGRADVWKHALAADEVNIELRREPENPYDPNAIAVFAEGQLGGYLPKDFAAALVKDDAEYSVTDYEIDVKQSKGNASKNRVTVKLSLQIVIS